MNRLKELRKEKSLTQQSLADDIGVHFRTLQNWENGKADIKSDKAQALADYFEVSVGYLLGYSDNPKKYDDEKIEVQHDGRLWVYSEKREYDKDLQIFVKCLKELDVVISDDQIVLVFNLIQSMNLNNEKHFIGSHLAYDVFMDRDVDIFYNDMSKNGYSLLVEDTNKATKELRLFDELSNLSKN